MRYLLALLLTVPVWAQQTQQQQGQPAAAEKTKTEQAPLPEPVAAVPISAEAAAAGVAPSPLPPDGEWFTGSIDLGYRWLFGVGGSEQQYRTLINQLQRPELVGVDFTIRDPKRRAFDTLQARGYGWGSEPYNSAYVNARKQGIYDFTADYRNVAQFSNILSYANPFAPNGFDQQSLDTRRRMSTLDLTLFPNKHIVPYLGWWQNSNQGTGVQTWVLGATNSFPVPISLRDSTQNYRGGARLEYRLFHVTLEQGGTTFKEDDSSTFNGSNPGNLTTPVLGQTILLTSLGQAYAIRGDAIYSKILMTANPRPWVNLFGQFLYSQPKTDVHFNDIANGNLFLVQSLLFYSTQAQVATGSAKQPHTTGNLGFELRPTRRLRVMESWTTDRLHDAVSPFSITNLFNANGALVNSTVDALNFAQVVNYNYNELNVFYDLTRKLTLRGGWRRVWGNSTVLASSLSQAGNLESGDLSRNIAIAGVTYRPFQKLMLHADFDGAQSDRIYFRTSLNEYQRGRVQARYQATNSLSLQARFYVLNNQNPAQNIRYDFLSRANTLAVYWAPGGAKRFTLSGEYDRSTVRSSILYLDLPFLNQAVSDYRANSHTATAALDVAMPGYAGLTPKLTVGGSLFINSGSRPTTFYEPLARLSVPLQKHVYWNTEWQYYGYNEAFFVYEGFRAHTFLTGVRLTR